MMDPMSGDERLDGSGMRRTARLMGLGAGAAGRGVRGLGQKLRGRDAAAVDAAMHEQTAAQVFAVLGELKGGAMKVGQLWSMMEAALPEEVAAPYREQLRKLQAAAPPLPASRVHAAMAAELGPAWRSMFGEFNPRASAAASIGQVHRGTWAATGEPVAIKLQYPGAEEALRADLKAMERLASLMSPLAGGFDVKGAAREMADHVVEETDYTREAEAQQQAAAAFAGDDQVLVPSVLAHTRRVLVSQWIDGAPLMSAETADGAERNRLGFAYARFLFRCPSVAGLLHADPHPGNFLIVDDGRLAVLDWGLAQRLPNGLPAGMGPLLNVAASGDAAAMVAGLREAGFVTRDIDVDTLFDYLQPFVEPAKQATFHFDRDWLKAQFQRIGADKMDTRVVNALNLPPEYVLIDRVWLSALAVLCQLDVTAPFESILAEWVPGWVGTHS